MTDERAQATQARATEAHADEFQQTRDRSLFWTLSFYVERDRVVSALGNAPDPAFMGRFQSGYLDSKRLRDAMEPLFNDIADRERQGSVGDFLLDTTGPVQGETIQISLEGPVRWSTEGTTYEAAPKGLSQTKAVQVRRFWYAHRNGALSYHVSFNVEYDHTAADFFFLSLLQKLAAPKEFEAAVLPAGKALWRATDTGVGVYPLEKIKVSAGGAAGGKTELFWAYLKRRFEADVSELFSAMAKEPEFKQQAGSAPRFEELVLHAPFIETPGLFMPLSRQLFFFRDDVLFKRLLPPLALATKERPSRAELVQEAYYDWYPEEIQRRIDARPKTSKDPVALDEAYWAEAMQVQHAGTPALPAGVEAPSCASDPDERLQYLFLSGFNQNIVDFMNQDASEILDSTDPLYPSEEDSDESFFVRYANPRALITYVRRSRSLETGNDYIGTCPYAFLIHVTSMHNEFLARDYEEKTYALVGDVRGLNEKGRFKKAAQKFYDFRMTAYAEYAEHRYPNIFRYDTEGDVFEAMEKLRGTARKDELLEKLVGNTENQTRDLEARISKEDEQLMNRLLGAVGVFGFFQLMFQWAASIGPSAEPGMGATFSWSFPFLHIGDHMMATNSGALTVVALVLSMGFSVVLLGFAAYTLGKFLVRKILG